MHETEQPSAQDSVDDETLTELLRAAGRRPTPPAEHREAAFAAAHAAWQRTLASRRRVRVTLGAAASFAALACAVVLLRLMLPAPSSQVAVTQRIVGDVALFEARTGSWEPLQASGRAVAAGDHLRTLGGAGATLALASGYSLRLDGGTQLELLTVDSLRLMSGSAYIDSGHAPNATPISIDTRFGLIRDVGTQFEVRVTDQALRVRVRSGSVELRQDDNAVEITAAGEELAVSAAGGVQRQPFSASHEDWQWVQRLAVAPSEADLSVLSYLEWIANETGRELRFDSDNTELSAEITRFAGDPSGFTPMEVLDSIELTSSFAYQLLNDDVILVRRKQR